MGRKNRRYSRNNRQHNRSSASDNSWQEVSGIPGFKIQYTNGGGRIWIPTDQPPTSGKKRKSKVHSVSEEQIEAIAIQVFGGTTYFSHQHSEEVQT